MFSSPVIAYSIKPTSHRRRTIEIRCSENHFERSSLQARGTSNPADVIQHCLVHLRNPDRFDTQLLKYMPPTTATSSTATATNSTLTTTTNINQYIYDPPPPPIQIPERSPLSQWSSTLDIGARRVFPGHLLRRSRVLSTLQLQPSLFQQRVALTACHGEEAVFEWSLRYELSSGDAPYWTVTSVVRDGTASGDYPPVPSSSITPHPRCSPEAIVLAQLRGLGAGDVYEAASFMIWPRLPDLKQRTTSSSFVEQETRTTSNNYDSNDTSTQTNEQQQAASTSNAAAINSLGLPYQQLKTFLTNPANTILLSPHTDIQLGPAVLATQRCQIQQVLVCDGDSGERVWFMWTLGMQSNGCWMVTGIERL